MKTFAWNKLPVNKIFGKNNIWTKMAKTFEKEKSAPIGRTMMSMSGSWYLNDRNINFSKICSAKSECYALLIIIFLLRLPRHGESVLPGGSQGSRDLR